MAVGLIAALLPTLPAEAVGTTSLISVIDGAPVEDGQSPAISSDGSTVVFSATAEGVFGLYARNRSTGTTDLLNVTASGTPSQGRQGLNGWDVSADGRYVVFATDTTDFDHPVPAPGCAEKTRDRVAPRIYSVQCRQVYLRDLLYDTTTLVSVDSDGAPLVLGGKQPVISADGQTVAFISGGELTLSGTYSRLRAIVHDRAQGLTEEASVNTQGVASDGSHVGEVDLSADGNTVVFASNASNLGAKVSAGGSDIFIRDLTAKTTTPAVPAGTRVLQNGESYGPTVSGDGNIVAFTTQAKLTVEDSKPGASWRVYVVANGGPPTLIAPDATYTDQPQLSDDGRFLLFRGSGGGFGEGFTGVHVADLASGAITTVSRNSSNTSINASTGFHSISVDGRFVAWTALDNTIVDANLSGDTDQVYVTDMTPTSDVASGTNSASTGTVPTLTDVIETSVSGSPGAVTVEELSQSDPVQGWSVLGQQVAITAEPATSGYLTFTFTTHSSITPFGLAPADVAVLRNGDPLPTCSTLDDVGPCVAQRTALASGDWQFVAHSPRASVWAIAVPARQADTTAPVITVNDPRAGARYLLDEQVTASYSCDDGVSGSTVVSCAGPVLDGAPLDTASIGPKQFTVTTADEAGNTASSTVDYTVVWPLTALLTPVANAPTLNTMKAGGTVPVRFALGANRGLSVLAGPPDVQQVTCPTGTTREIDELVHGKAAPLSIDAKSRYTYAWATNQTWAGTCRELILTFTDGQQRTAIFKLRK